MIPAARVYYYAGDHGEAVNVGQGCAMVPVMVFVVELPVYAIDGRQVPDLGAFIGQAAFVGWVYAVVNMLTARSWAGAGNKPPMRYFVGKRPVIAPLPAAPKVGQECGPGVGGRL